MRFFCLLLIPISLLASCSQYGKVSFAESPQVINVSEYDPKEQQLPSKARFTPLNQTALKKSGALGLIARCGKGTHIDTKCAQFLQGADQQNFLLGTYYFVLPNTSATSQARNYISRLRNIKSSSSIRSSKVLLVADFDTKCSVSKMVTFLSEVYRLTGVRPVVYLENSDTIRANLNNASRQHKAFLRKHPYWLALYSNKHAAFKTPKELVQGSGVWDTWAMWQYAGVWWKNGRSVPHHYQGGNWRTPRYFGNLGQPSERNGFNGSKAELLKFWDAHSWNW